MNEFECCRGINREYSNYRLATLEIGLSIKYLNSYPSFVLSYLLNNYNFYFDALVIIFITLVFYNGFNFTPDFSKCTQINLYNNTDYF